MKSYTDLKQSRIIAEILPHNTADQIYERFTISGANLDVPEEMLYKHNGDVPFQICGGIGIPCWSLAALLDILPRYIERDGHMTFLDIYQTKNFKWVIEYSNNKDDFVEYVFNAQFLIDACVETIVKLKELKVL